jgi:hypothetical protein
MHGGVSIFVGKVKVQGTFSMLHNVAGSDTCVTFFFIV